MKLPQASSGCSWDVLCDLGQVTQPLCAMFSIMRISAAGAPQEVVVRTRGLTHTSKEIDYNTGTV